MEDMEKEKITLQSDTEHYSDQVADLTCVSVNLFNRWPTFLFLWIKLFDFCVLGPAITTETPDYDRNVPGEWAQAAQVYAHAYAWTTESTAIWYFWNSDSKNVFVGCWRWRRESVFRKRRSWTKQTKTSRWQWRNWTTTGGCSTICSRLKASVSLSCSLLCLTLLQATSWRDGGRAGEKQTVLPDSDIGTWKEGS